MRLTITVFVVFCMMILSGCIGKKAEIKPVKTVQPEIKPVAPENYKDEFTGMDFKLIKSGCFQMGSGTSHKYMQSDELPAHNVCLDDFYMGVYEVTNAQFRMFKKEHDSGKFGEESLNGENQPVVYVNWKEARDFADWLSGKTGKVFRLPTEAEWEYAARAGTETNYYWAEEAGNICEYANIHDVTSKKINELDWEPEKCDDGYAVSSPVGSFKPNAWGLYDMAGNVWEWISDVYEKDAYTKHTGKNPFHDAVSDKRVLRGGSWFSLGLYTRTSNRDNDSVNSRYNRLGFRLVMEK